jgi:FkbM family methyltransferase
MPLLEASLVKQIIEKYKIILKGVLHVGAHKCQEKEFYNNDLQIPDTNIVWVEGNPWLVDWNREQGVQNIYLAVLDEVIRDTTFYVTNIDQSSSLLELGTHKESYPYIDVSMKVPVRTETLSSFFEKNNLRPGNYNVWNFDIQGAEVQVFRGSKELLRHVDILLTEVNTQEVYKGCGLLEEMDTILKEAGLTRIDIRMVEGAGWGDAVYVRV